MSLWRCFLSTTLALLLAACGSASAPSQTASDSVQASPPGSAPPTRSLVMAGGRSPESLGSKPLREVGGAGWPRAAIRALNAGLALRDGREVPRPYLTEGLPQIGSDTWRVFPDGRMETSYRLKPNLTWHDGTGLSAKDFVFGWRVYATPEFGLAASPPLRYIDEVVAPDDRTVVIRWGRSYAEADSIDDSDLPPLPRHLLEQSFAQGEPDAFVGHEFWVSDYVGLGPYRLVRYELGSLLEVETFAGHALGPPRIGRILFQFTTDPNTALAQVLADAAHVISSESIDLEQALVLERDWVRQGQGTVLRSPIGVRHSNFQLRPEHARPKVLLDLRARQAIAYATDRVALAETLTETREAVADVLLLPQVDYYAAVERAITKYPHDTRRAEQLLNEVGFQKGGDGMFTSPAEGRFSLEVAVAAGSRNDREVTIMVDGLRSAGIDATINVIPRAQIADRQMRTRLPGILNGSHNRGAAGPPIQRLRASEIPTAANGWKGGNQTGWTHPEMERLISGFETSLDRTERADHVVSMLKLASEELPIFALYYNLSFLAHSSVVRGPGAYVSNDTAHWNLHEWSWSR